MTVLANIFLEGTVLFTAGAGLSYWLWRWRERNRRDTLAVKEQAALESARREAGAVLQQARLTANETALQLRQQHEQSLAERRRELEDTVQRLNEREGLINRQLERLVQEESQLREQMLAGQKQAEGLESERRALAELTRQRREQLQILSRLTPAEARLCRALADGLSLADYCEKYRVSAHTARDALKDVFDKTSTRRQVDLLRLIFLFTRS